MIDALKVTKSLKNVYPEQYQDFDPADTDWIKMVMNEYLFGAFLSQLIAETPSFLNDKKTELVEKYGEAEYLYFDTQEYRISFISIETLELIQNYPDMVSFNPDNGPDAKENIRFDFYKTIYDDAMYYFKELRKDRNYYVRFVPKSELNEAYGIKSKNQVFLIYKETYYLPNMDIVTGIFDNDDDDDIEYSPLISTFGCDLNMLAPACLDAIFIVLEMYAHFANVNIDTDSAFQSDFVNTYSSWITNVMKNTICSIALSLSQGKTDIQRYIQDIGQENYRFDIIIDINGETSISLVREQTAEEEEEELRAAIAELNALDNEDESCDDPNWLANLMSESADMYSETASLRHELIEGLVKSDEDKMMSELNENSLSDEEEDGDSTLMDEIDKNND